MEWEWALENFKLFISTTQNVHKILQFKLYLTLCDEWNRGGERVCILRKSMKKSKECLDHKIIEI
jgi:hypothetical protein